MPRRSGLGGWWPASQPRQPEDADPQAHFVEPWQAGTVQAQIDAVTPPLLVE